MNDDRETVLKIENVGKKYVIRRKVSAASQTVSTPKKKYKLKKLQSEDFWALRNISFELKEGERLGIVGRNGAGKSTLLKLISRITEPTEGRIEYVGTVAAMLEVGTGFNIELTGRENVYLNGAILGISRKEIDERFDGIVEFSEIGKFIDTPVKKYSSGMMVRLAFAVASTMNPDILIIDEVLSVGDMRFRAKCLRRMAEIAGQGKTIICVSHMMGIIRELCDRAIVLDGGRIVYDGEVEGAIRLYNGRNEDVRAGHYEYDIGNRTKGYNCDRLIIRSLDILENTECVYRWNEPIRFSINVDALTDEKDVSLRVRFWRDDDIPAATAFIPMHESFSAGESADIVVSVERHNLAPGNYKVAVTLTGGQPYDLYNNIDSIEPDAFFITVLNIGSDDGDDMRDDPGRFWSPSWGRSRITDAAARVFRRNEADTD